MERRLYVLIAAFVVASSGCGRARFAMHQLFGEEEPKDEIRFSHEQHLGGESSCVDCHAGVDKDAATRPDHDDCAGTCHDVKAEDGCKLCHSSPEHAKRSAPVKNGELLFAHATHMERTKGNCMRCHEEVAVSTQLVPRPEMDSCADGCHESDFKDLRCSTCHQDLSQYPLEGIQSFTHGREFEKRHGPKARQSADTCATCHETTFCSDCHADNTIVAGGMKELDRPVRASIHPAPYETTHALDAQAGRDRCDSCHRPTFCTSCHALQGVAAVAKNSAEIHPDGWLDPTAQSFHGVEARRAIATCASCHDRGEQSVCVRCHQVGGTGGNPHPRGFERREQPADNRMCRVCHI